MLIPGLMHKVFMKSSSAERGLNIIFRKVKHNVKCRNIASLNFSNKIMRSSMSEYLFTRRACAAEKFSSRGYSIKQTTFLKKENNVQVKSSFEEMMYARKMQAQRSVLIEVAEKSEIPFAVARFEKYASIAKIYSYCGERENCFLLLEFSSEVGAQNDLLNCSFKNIDDVFPVSSRIVLFEKKSNNMPANINLNVNEETCSDLSFKPGASISEVIEKIYINEKLTELDIRLRFFLCSLIKDAISGAFPHCDVLPFGSSVNGVGKRGCDLDIVIRLYPDKINEDEDICFVNKTCVGKQKNLQQRALQALARFLCMLPGVYLSQEIMFARVPILKMQHKILNLDFDVSVNNMSAVLMSDILHFCGQIDYRVSPLVHVVKKWAKESNITQDSAGSQISNFGLTNLVIFFLQTRKPHPIIPPLNDALVIQGSYDSNDIRLQYLNSIEHWKKYASLNKESLASLLKEFLVFLSSFPFHEKIISLLGAETRTRGENSLPIYIEYILDEALNVTKNVSKAQYDAMCEKARISAESNLDQTIKNEKDFSAYLRIPSVSRIAVKNSKFNVNSLLENEKNFQNRRLKYKVT